jgi:hypothetical protein
MTETATTQKFFKVTLKGEPIMGFTDADGLVHFKRPMEVHWHPPINTRVSNSIGQQISPGWYTEAELVNHGIDEKIAKKQGWFSQRRPSLNVRADNYNSAYIAADSASHAKDRYRKKFKIRSANTSNFKSVPAPEDVTRESPVDLSKKKKPKPKDDPWADID